MERQTSPQTDAEKANWLKGHLESQGVQPDLQFDDSIYAELYDITASTRTESTEGNND